MLHVYGYGCISRSVSPDQGWVRNGFAVYGYRIVVPICYAVYLIVTQVGKGTADCKVSVGIIIAFHAAVY